MSGWCRLQPLQLVLEGGQARHQQAVLVFSSHQVALYARQLVFELSILSTQLAQLLLPPPAISPRLLLGSLHHLL